MDRWLDEDGKEYVAWNAKRQTDRAEIFIDLKADDELPTSAVDLVGWLAARLDNLPKEYRAAATFEIEHESDYDGPGYCVVTFGYSRFETHEEVAARIALDRKKRADWRAAEEAREREQFERLARKYAVRDLRSKP